MERIRRNHYTFQLAIGLIRSAEVTRTNLARGIGVHPEFGARNLIEFDYFPDAGFGATVALTAVSSNNQFRFSHNFPLEMTPGATFRAEMSYTASNRILRASMTRDGQPFGLPRVKPSIGLAGDAARFSRRCAGGMQLQ
jgi:hypothetical protein